MRSFAAVYCGFSVALALTLILVHSVTICMHVNIGALFLGALVFFSAAFVLAFRKVRQTTILAITTLVLAVCVIGLIVLYTFVFPQSLIAQPSMVVKLAFNLPYAPSHLLGLVLVVVLAAGYAILAFRTLK